MSEQSKILETFYNEFKDHLSEEKMMQLGEMVLYMEHLAQNAAKEAHDRGFMEACMEYGAFIKNQNGQKQN